jgi:hypothetical protein
MSSAFAQPAAVGLLPSITKDPDAVLDYKMAWKDWLDGDTIATSTWTIPTGLTGSSQAINSGATVTIEGIVHPVSSVTTTWLTGGTAGLRYRVTNRVVTAGGRTDDRSFDVIIADK